MAKIARKSDGRRIFTDEFKTRHLARVRRGELTITELGRELGIARSLLHRWKRGTDSTRSIAPLRRLGTTQYVRELQLLIGKQTLELELLRAEVEALRKGRRHQGSSRPSRHERRTP